jgi:medium-chain acyl-[acyl-carrier-protein] hydrolase
VDIPEFPVASLPPRGIIRDRFVPARTPMFQVMPSRSRPAIRLFCIPHAGAGPSVFRGWKEDLGPEIEATVVQLPGREARFREEPYLDLEPLVHDLTKAVLPHVDAGQRFAFFGNSLGGLIAFESLHEIQRRAGYQAVHLFVSSAVAPHLDPPLPPIGLLDDQTFVREICERYSGIPQAILEDDEFLAAMLPAMRADVCMLEAYERRPPQPLSCPITAFGGIRDRAVSTLHIDGWSAQTTSDFTRILLDEGHFYLQSAKAKLTACVREKLLASLCFG